MDYAQELHNAARRYCIDQHAHWCSEYQALDERGRAREGSGYSREAYDTFPRYNILSAILNEVERIDPDQLPGYAELADLLIRSAHSANSVFTQKPSSLIEVAAIADERQRFVDWIRRMAPDSLPATSPLPYRRVLSGSEVAALWGRVGPRWGANGSYFFPLADRTDASLRAFNTVAFDAEFPAPRLRTILHAWGVRRLYELREYGDGNYLLSVDCWEPYYDGAEGFWFSDSLEWIMYASHEGSMTTGGTLTEAILSLWPEPVDFRWRV